MIHLCCRIVVLIASLGCLAGAGGEPIASDGEYVGLEPIPNMGPEEPNDKWFHENRLVIRNDEAVLDKLPIVLSQGKKLYSASDGGFLTYRARFVRRNGKTFLAARLFQSEYVAFRDEEHRYSVIREFPVRISANEIRIEKVRYRRTVLEKRILDVLLDLLATEPFEKHN